MHAGESAEAEVSFALSSFLASLRFEDLPVNVIHECRRGVLDWMGCALIGSVHEAIPILLSAFDDIASTGRATIVGHRKTLGLLEAAIVNGQMGHVLDFDDTLLLRTTVLHTSSPVLSALFGLSETTPVTGRQLFLAYVCSFEAGIRAGLTAPNHLEQGWHLTGTLGTIATAAGAAKLLGLGAEGINTALAIGCTQAAGMQQNRGTMCKSFHAGKSSSNGLLAALLSRRGFTGSRQIIEGGLGFSTLYSTVSQPELFAADLGRPLMIAKNGYKPYACGVVLHPTIDAVLDVRPNVHSALDDIVSVKLRAHPHVLSVTGTRAPQTGLQGKFSVYHTIAVALVDGAAGATQYTDARVADPAVARLRDKIHVSVDAGFRKDQCELEIITATGRFGASITHASGTAENPVSDQRLEAKFFDNAIPVLGTDRARRLADDVWRLDSSKDVASTFRLAVPE